MVQYTCVVFLVVLPPLLRAASTVDFGASFWQPFDFVVTFEAPFLGIGRPGGVSGKRAASESGAAKS